MNQDVSNGQHPGDPMFVVLVTESRYVGPRNEALTYENCDVQTALEAVKRMNGRDRSMVLLEGPNDTTLTIGGGNDGRYVVTLSINIDEEFYNAVDDSKAQGPELKVVTGGQASEFPARSCLNLDGALEAARVFFETGKMSDRIGWEKQ